MSLLAKPVGVLLNGLVLAGGRSTRMGQDKGLLNWNGKAQREHLADVLKPFCENVYISCRPDQKEQIDPEYLVMEDLYQDIGPFSGVLSAFHKDASIAWLVIACDYPGIDFSCISYLIEQRDCHKLATAYKNDADGFAEPLLSIWEPAIYPALLSSFKAGHTSLRKVLMNNDIKLVKSLAPEKLVNVNTPAEAAKIRNISR